MVNLQYFKKKIKDVSAGDMLALFPMTVALLTSPLFKRKYRNTWLVCEEKNEARDNGYHFFKYLCKEQPQQDCYYAISPKCKDWNKIKQLGKAVPYGSIRHWILYFTARYNISSQKGGKPNAALCSFFELNGLFHPCNVFLQHGITKDKNDWLMADRCRFSYFVTACASEDSFVRHAFGYDPATVHFTGFPRFDNLHDAKIVKNRIIIMPTWRKWLKSRSERNEELTDSISESGFMQKWLELLNSSELGSLIQNYGLEVIFYPHRGMQPFLQKFKIENKKVTLAAIEDYDMQELMKSAALMITDYSSVYFDMFYMKKPVIFYQFDEEEFRKYHYEEGWFDYHNNPFANSYDNYRDVLGELETYIKNGFQIPERFLEGHRREFLLYDRQNSERIYKDLRNLALD